MDIERWLRVCEQYDAALVWAPTSEFPGGWPALSVPSVLEGAAHAQRGVPRRGRQE